MSHFEWSEKFDLECQETKIPVNLFCSQLQPFGFFAKRRLFLLWAFSKLWAARATKNLSNDTSEWDSTWTKMTVAFYCTDFRKLQKLSKSWKISQQNNGNCLPVWFHCGCLRKFCPWKRFRRTRLCRESLVPRVLVANSAALPPENVDNIFWSIGTTLTQQAGDQAVPP